MAENLFNKVYNPDVLSCLANLSNDEVFTPPEIVNAMLDLLPQELFQYIVANTRTAIFRSVILTLLKEISALSVFRTHGKTANVYIAAQAKRNTIARTI